MAADTIITELKKTRRTNIGIIYVAGMITSAGPEHIAANLERLDTWTHRVRSTFGVPTFSAPWAFPNDCFERLRAELFGPEFWEPFWESILGSGYVSDIVFTPRWQQSRGALDEHRVAKQYGLRIIYVEGDACRIEGTQQTISLK